MAKKIKKITELQPEESGNDEVTEIFQAVAEQKPDLLKGIPIPKQRELKEAFSIGISMVQQIHSGPLPAPQTLELYAKIIPEGAERIMSMAEKEQAFRHEYDKTMMGRQKNIESRGQFFGFIICLFVLGGGIWLSYTGKETSGLCAIVGALVALVGAFYYTQRIKSEKQ